MSERAGAGSGSHALTIMEAEELHIQKAGAQTSETQPNVFRGTPEVKVEHAASAAGQAGMGSRP